MTFISSYFIWHHLLGLELKCKTAANPYGGAYQDVPT
jgi:hypothetical protein